jgi:hypothetical protein
VPDTFHTPNHNTAIISYQQSASGIQSKLCCN